MPQELDISPAGTRKLVFQFFDRRHKPSVVQWVRVLVAQALMPAASSETRRCRHECLRHEDPHPLHYTGLVTTIEELEDELSRPRGRDVEFLRHLEGDILILGASGKMGPSLARLCRRTADAAGPARRMKDLGVRSA